MLCIFCIIFVISSFLKIASESLDTRFQFVKENAIASNFIGHRLQEAFLFDNALEKETEQNVCAENPKPWSGKPWRVAKSLLTLRDQIDKSAPARDKSSDGTIGDFSHQQRNSDHNPQVLDVENDTGIVTAMDITHDPDNTCDCNALAETLSKNRDERIKYLIWNKRICNYKPINGSPAWAWREYDGADPHNHHIHISVRCDKTEYDSEAAWKLVV